MKITTSKMTTESEFKERKRERKKEKKKKITKTTESRKISMEKETLKNYDKKFLQKILKIEQNFLSL